MDTPFTWETIDLAFRGAVPLALDAANVHIRRASNALAATNNGLLVRRAVLLAAISDRVAGDAQILRSIGPIVDFPSASKALTTQLTLCSRSAANWMREAAGNAELATGEAGPDRRLANLA